LSEQSISRLFADNPPAAPIADDSNARSFIDVSRAIATICATRVLLLIAVITGAGIWGFTVYAPSSDRLYAAIAYSLVFVLPQVILYWQRGSHA
jgi:hypothetical protein